MSTLVAQTISNGTVSTSSANVIQGSAKAWIQYDSNASTIQASYNVSSVTKNATGNITVNFTNAFADTKYSWAGSVGYNSVAQTAWLSCPNSTAQATWCQTTSLNVWATYQNGTLATSNPTQINLVIFR